MPVTSFDIPQNLLDFMNMLVQSGAARNRREIVVHALEMFVKFQGHKWDGPLIFVNGVREGIISKGSVAELVSTMSDVELRNAGRRMGKSLKALALQRRIDISQPENHKAALEILEDFGWGRFSLYDKQITIASPFPPAIVMHGYLETALSVTLRKLDTSEDLCIFEIESKPRLEVPSGGSQRDAVRNVTSY